MSRGSNVFTNNPEKFPRAQITKSSHSPSQVYNNLKPALSLRSNRKSSSPLVDTLGRPLESQKNEEAFYEVSEYGQTKGPAFDGISRRRANFTPSMNFDSNLETHGFDVTNGPSREFYDFRATPTFWQLPQQDMFQQLNYLRRAIYLRDEIVGPGLDLISEIPYGDAEFITDDLSVKELFNKAADVSGLFDFIPRLTLHYLIHGEALPWHWWDDEEGMWGFLYSIDPNDVKIAHFPYSHLGEVVQLNPGQHVQFVVNSSDPIYKEIQKNMPSGLLQQLKAGRKIILKPKNVTYILRENFMLQDSYSFQVRGQSIIDRLFRIWIYYEKIMEAEMAIADNYIYPLNIVKVGNDFFRPNQEDLEAVKQQIDQSRFDVRPFLVYHNAIEFDRADFASGLGDFTGRFERLDDLKLIALGIAKDMLFGESSLASSRTEVQVLVMRLSTLRSKIEKLWLYPKFLDPIAEAHEIYKTSPARIRHKIKVKDYKTSFFRDPENPITGKIYSKREEDKQLATPRVGWQTRLHAVQDSDFVGTLKDLSESERDPKKGYISKTTLMSSLGLDFETEMKRIAKDTELEDKLFGKDEEEEKGEGEEATEEGSFYPTGSWFKKLRRAFFGGKEKTKEKDIEYINKFFAHENEVLYKAGIPEQYTPSQALQLYAGAFSYKKKGSLSDAIIIPDYTDAEFVCSSYDTNYFERLANLKNFSSYMKEHLEFADRVAFEILDNMENFQDGDSSQKFSYVKDGMAQINGWLDDFEDKNVEFVEYAYDQGKKCGYSQEDSKIINYRKQKGYVSAGYENSKFITTISNFEDSEIVNNMKNSLRDSVRKLVKKVEGKSLKEFEWDLRRIVRSIGINTYNLAILHGMLEQGKKHFRWANDIKVDGCPICRARNGKVYEISSFLEQYGSEWCKASHLNCFVANTKVKTPMGLKNIQDLKIGDYVFDHYGVTKVIKTSERIHTGEFTEINGVFSTPEHPYITKFGEVVDAEDLEVGEFLFANRL